MTVMSDSERSFATHKAQPVMEAIVSNLDAAAEHSYVMGERPNHLAGTFVIVGAGPSLAQTGPHLSRLQESGAYICTVNTALKAVHKHGVRPDVVLVREVVDVSSHLLYPAALRVLDLGASPKVWQTAADQGECTWFIAGASQYFELAAQLGVRPLFGGTAALTAMVALAEEWGAERIILLGCDLALSDEGSSYAPGSAFDGQRAVIDDKGIATNTGAGFDVKQAQHAAGGIAPHPKQEATIEVERWGGGTVRTTAQWIDQVPWLADFAARHPDIECIDATGAGARKRGWTEVLITEFDFDAEENAALYEGEHVEPLVIERARQHVLAQCEITENVAATVLDPNGCVALVPGYLDGCDLVEAAASGAMLRNLERPASVIDRIKTAYGEVLPGQTERIRALLLRASA